MFCLKDLVARGEESPSHRYSRECMSDLGDHTLKLLEWNPSHAHFTRVDPSVEDREEVGLFCLFQPNVFVDSIKIKIEYGLCSSIFPIALLELLLRDGVIGIVVISHEDIMDSHHSAYAHMPELLLRGRYDQADKIINIYFEEVSEGLK
jgi:hypothetical protein